MLACHSSNFLEYSNPPPPPSSVTKNPELLVILQCCLVSVEISSLVNVEPLLSSGWQNSHGRAATTQANWQML